MSSTELANELGRRIKSLHVNGFSYRIYHDVGSTFVPCVEEGCHLELEPL